MRVWSLIAVLVFASPAAAQEVMTDAEVRAAAEQAREAAELRVEADMMTMTDLVEAMSKTLGQLHYLRTLCYGLTDQQWRRQMSAMLQVEAPNNSERQRELSQAFNAGFYQEQARHARCDAGVAADVAALAENGRSVATMLGDPYRETQ